MSEEPNPLPMAELIGNGFFNLEMTDDGILIYKLSENAEQIAPHAYLVIKKAMVDEILEFAKQGYVECRFDENLDLEYRFTESGIQYMKEQGYPTDDI